MVPWALFLPTQDPTAPHHPSQRGRRGAQSRVNREPGSQKREMGGPRWRTSRCLISLHDLHAHVTLLGGVNGSVSATSFQKQVLSLEAAQSWTAVTNLCNSRDKIPYTYPAKEHIPVGEASPHPHPLPANSMEPTGGHENRSAT